MKLWKHTIKVQELETLINRISIFRHGGTKLLEVTNAGPEYVVSYLSKEKLI
jgi:hypothetical protein